MPPAPLPAGWALGEVIVGPCEIGVGVVVGVNRDSFVVLYEQLENTTVIAPARMLAEREQAALRYAGAGAWPIGGGVDDADAGADAGRTGSVQAAFGLRPLPPSVASHHEIVHSSQTKAAVSVLFQRFTQHAGVPRGAHCQAFAVLYFFSVATKVSPEASLPALWVAVKELYPRAR
jgi:hypothetical protein